MEGLSEVEIIVIPCVSNQLNADSAAVVSVRGRGHEYYKGAPEYVTKILCVSQLHEI